MGFDAINWALEVKAPSVNAKLSLLVFAIRADGRGASFPSLRDIAEKCQCCENTARTAVRELVKANLVYIAERRRANGGCSSNEYVLMFDEASRAYASSMGWKDPDAMAKKIDPEKKVEPDADREPRGHHLPKDWHPGEELVAFGIGLGFTRDQVLGELLDEFADYWRAVPGAKGRKLDWDATFRNSLRKTKERKGSRQHWKSPRSEPKRNPLFDDLIGRGATSSQVAPRPSPPSEPLVHHLEGLGPPRLRRLG